MVNKIDDSRKETEDKLRIAIINADRCRPKRCKLECKKLVQLIKQVNYVLKLR